MASIIVILALFILVGWLYTMWSVGKEREAWQKERKDLIDRIQAPTFAEYTNKVVREKKAENPPEEAKAPEFIS